MIRTRRELDHYLRADMWFTCQSPTWRPGFYVSRRALYYQRVLRHAEFWQSKSSLVGRAMLLIYKLRLARLGERTGMLIPRGTCGPGLSVAHPGLLIVNGDARLGARCRLSQGVTIGASMRGAPILGDDVFVGSNAQVIGPVRVGDGATVLPGAVVSADVPAGATVGGVPAKVIRIDTRPWHEVIAPTPPFPALHGGTRHSE